MWALGLEGELDVGRTMKLLACLSFAASSWPIPARSEAENSLDEEVATIYFAGEVQLTGVKRSGNQNLK